MCAEPAGQDGVPNPGRCRDRRIPPPARAAIPMPLTIFDLLAEQRIADAIKRGELDDLPGAGRPLEFDDDPLLSPEQRMANRILKNAGVVPAEIGLRREIAALRARLANAGADDSEALRRRLGYLIAQLGALHRK